MCGQCDDRPEKPIDWFVIGVVVGLAVLIFGYYYIKI